MGTRQQCRDNVTMFSGQTIVGYCIITIFDVTTPFRHRDLISFRIFFVFEALLHCPIVVVAKLKNCRVPKFAKTQRFVEVVFTEPQVALQADQADQAPSSKPSKSDQ